MAAVTTQKCTVRRIRLQRALRLLEAMIEINEQAAVLEMQLVAAASDAADIASGVNAVLAAAGPPYTRADGTTPIAEAGNGTDTGNLTNQLFNMLNGPIVAPEDVAESVGWSYLAETA